MFKQELLFLTATIWKQLDEKSVEQKDNERQSHLKFPIVSSIVDLKEFNYNV